LRRTSQFGHLLSVATGGLWASFQIEPDKRSNDMLNSASPLNSKLNAFRRRQKFSAAAWRKRGLLPSNGEISGELNSFFNELATSITADLSSTNPSKIQAQLLTTALADLDRHAFDTEEAEFICSLFAELAAILSLSLGTALNIWLYGEELGDLPPRQAEEDTATRISPRISQPCTGCAAPLISEVNGTDERNQSESWLGVECLSCGELNFLVLPPQLGSMRPVGYKVSQYWRGFTKEKAQTAFAAAYAKKRSKGSGSPRRRR
jgi:hypothetical protein